MEGTWGAPAGVRRPTATSDLPRTAGLTECGPPPRTGAVRGQRFLSALQGAKRGISALSLLCDLGKVPSSLRTPWAHVERPHVALDHDGSASRRGPCPSDPALVVLDRRAPEQGFPGASLLMGTGRGASSRRPESLKEPSLYGNEILEKYFPGPNNCPDLEEQTALPRVWATMHGASPREPDAPGAGAARMRPARKALPCTVPALGRRTGQCTGDSARVRGCLGLQGERTGRNTGLVGQRGDSVGVRAFVQTHRRARVSPAVNPALRPASILDH